MSTPLQGSWSSPLTANNTTAQPLATTTLTSPLPPASSGSLQRHLTTPTSCWCTISSIAFAGGVLLARVVAVICLLVSCFWRWSTWLPSASPSIPHSSSKRIFTLDEVRELTNDFSEANLLGEGGFGCVYHGVLSTREEVAVKRLKGGSSTKELGFQAEVETVGRIQHRNIVSLVGYCIDGPEHVLVYEYVPNRSLDFHLHLHGAGYLAWEARMRVAVGCANGFAFLHEDCHPTIVHCDIKPANILLSSDFEPKIADFGLAKFASESNHCVSRQGGIIGYFAPEYTSVVEQTPCSDTLLFGVLLLELITGCRPSLSSLRPTLAQALEDGNFDSLVDPMLQNDYNHGEMTRMLACAAACIRELPQHRPRMSVIARVLEGHRSAADLDDGIGAGPSNLDLEYSNGHYGEPTGEYGLYPSGSSSAGPSHQIARDLEMGKMDAFNSF